MSIINKYRATKEAIKELQEQLENMSQDSELQKEMEFEKKLRELMAEYSKSLRDINALLDPQSLRSSVAGLTKGTGRPRRTRKTKRYSNPHTGEVIETKGGNHKELKEWKARWGAQTVESWSVTLD
ncbi:MAG: DNA binding protein [Thiopseudomonas sp.]|nr:DNA binding protein [Thiopseudomonas sp.]MCK9465050.1 DNA binding protein [Thiopseudomonas sp.]